MEQLPVEYKELTKEVDEKNHSLRLQTSDFIFALQSLQLTVLQFLKTIFLRYSLTVDSFQKRIFCVTVTVLQFLKSKIAHNNSGFCGFNSWQVKQGLFPCFH